jgi:thiol:disulfide interchange protein DsbD
MNLSADKINIPLAFLAGIVMSFSGCFYPMLPIFLGSLSKYMRKKFDGFILSFLFVSGFALVYSILGIIASFTGKIFGFVLTYPLIRIATGFIFILFGLLLLEVPFLKLKTVSFKISFLKSNLGYLNTFFMGISSALIISPCVSPALGSILLYVALKKEILYGWLLLLSFAYGIGFLLIVCGSFGSFLSKLPKSGIWMRIIEKVCGFLLISVGLYFIIANLNLK